jgi:hypothetical protein
MDRILQGKAEKKDLTIKSVVNRETKNPSPGPSPKGGAGGGGAPRHLYL